VHTNRFNNQISMLIRHILCIQKSALSNIQFYTNMKISIFFCLHRFKNTRNSSSAKVTL